MVQQLKQGCILAGTGHRPDKIAAQEEKVREAIRIRLGLYLPTLVISGMALGFDTWLAEEAQKLNFPVCAAIPFLGQESRWPAAQRATYVRILAHAKKVYIHHARRPESYDHTVALLQERNAWMVDNAQGILACYDGSSSGGTQNCIRYARTRQKPIVIINPYGC